MLEWEVCLNGKDRKSFARTPAKILWGNGRNKNLYPGGRAENHLGLIISNNTKQRLRQGSVTTMGGQRKLHPRNPDTACPRLQLEQDNREPQQAPTRSQAPSNRQ